MSQQHGRPVANAQHALLEAVTAVVVNYNTPDATLKCIESIYRTASGASVTMVDNGSRDDSVSRIRESFPAVRIIEMHRNAGFAAAVNEGVRQALTPYILLINSDAIAIRGSLISLVEFAKDNPRFGIYGGRTLRPDGSVDPSSCWGEITLWSTFCNAVGLAALFKRSKSFDPESLGSWERDTVKLVPVITGCLLLTQKSTWDNLGGMNEDYFLYGEDTDFSKRAWNSGLLPVVVPSATIEHAVGGSSNDSSRRSAMVLAGRITYIHDHFGTFAQLGSAIAEFGVFIRAAGEAIASPQRRHWTRVWSSRNAWRAGYPAARDILFADARPVGPDQEARP